MAGAGRDILTGELADRAEQGDEKVPIRGVLVLEEARCEDREPVLSAGRDDWAEVALTDLTMAHPDIRNLTSRLDVMRWGHAMVRPRPGFVWGGDRARAARPFRGVHFAGADLSGVPLFEEAFYHGVRAAEEVLAARGAAVESLLGRERS